MEIPISSLGETEYEQLQNSTTSPPTFLKVNSYGFDNRVGAVVYDISVGYQKDTKAVVHSVRRRFSELHNFDQKVRPTFARSPALRKFPPKTLFRNTGDVFLQKRAQDIQFYLSYLTQVPGMGSHPAFQDTFELSR